MGFLRFKTAPDIRIRADPALRSIPPTSRPVDWTVVQPDHHRTLLSAAILWLRINILFILRSDGQRFALPTAAVGPGVVAVADVHPASAVADDAGAARCGATSARRAGKGAITAIAISAIAGGIVTA